MKGYKVFESDWTCRGFQYEVGKTFEEDAIPVCCGRGFHFCKKLIDCFNYYAFNSNCKIAEVEAIGSIDTSDDDTKCCTNKIRIIRELKWHEVLELVNLGKGCTGLCNSGYRNSGNHNSGYRNSGNRNSGNHNSGNHNSGDWNSGDWNSGNRNSGNHNSGYRNSGDWNSGDWNSGDWNSGDWNSGDWNSGDWNSGDWNSGNRNSGNHNSGDWNKTNSSNGCFNTEEPKIFIFNKQSNWTYWDWSSSNAKRILDKIPSNELSWIDEDNMTDDEKEKHPEYEVTKGFLKYVKYNPQEWWDDLSNDEKNIVLTMPNFDKDIFKEITGIDVERV